MFDDLLDLFLATGNEGGGTGCGCLLVVIGLGVFYFLILWDDHTRSQPGEPRLAFLSHRFVYRSSQNSKSLKQIHNLDLGTQICSTCCPF